jgi:site-specific DNA-methyltransferase (adenine-specific)
MKLNKIYQGDCLEVLKTFPDESIDCVVTSPPYWACRDYGKQNEIIWDGDYNCNHDFETKERKIHSGTSNRTVQASVDKDGGYATDWKYTDKYCRKCNAWKGQLGLEEHPQQYINHIVQIIKECKRVLKPTGTIWLNLGDSFYTKSGSGQGSNYLERHNELDAGRGELHKAQTQTRGKFKSNWLQSKQKLLIPYRIAIVCQDELGLICRNDITWIKQIINWKTKESFGASMPTSVQDRLNTNSEAIFLFVKNPNYFFDLDAIRVKHKEVLMKRMNYGWDGHREPKSSYVGLKAENMCNPKGKNPGDCIMFPLEPSSENHYAMFPKTLPEFCIKAGCPKEVCNKCGKPKQVIQVIQVTQVTHNRVNDREDFKRRPDNVEVPPQNWKPKEIIETKEISCNCNAGFSPGIVLDPFSGGGTTCYVAKHLLRNYIGIEINPTYIKEIQNNKLAQDVLKLN